MTYRHVAGYLFGMGAGAVWGTTGPLSTALYAEGAALTGIGFWRILVGTLLLALWGLSRPGFFAMDRRGLLLVGGLGGSLVALFEVAYQFGIAGAGVAGAAALLYLAPVAIALIAKPILGERLGVQRLVLAVVVMVGAWLTVRGGHPGLGGVPITSLVAGVSGGLLAAASYAGTTVLARWAVPRYGTLRVLFWEIAGGSLILAVLLPIAGQTPALPPTAAGWLFVLALVAGPVLGANFLFFAAVKRIDAAPTAVAATVEPVVGALLALMLFNQRIELLGWIGLALVVGGVAAGYISEARENAMGEV
ncbi:MAG TPA: EamA family transporter [Gemmatimonadales bacterium]|nr:EamA family transporter [Gemmatimonadales bacterium]